MMRLKVIRALRGTLGLTDREVARLLDIPRASVRRLVSELRAHGVDVSTSAQGFYTLEGE